MSLAHARLMARYNAWMNERLYAAAGKLSDSDRKADRGAFFGSLHGTLNHILVGDLIWLQRFADGGWGFSTLNGLNYELLKPFLGLDMEVFPDFNQLQEERIAVDGAILAWANDELSEEILASDLSYVSIVTQSEMKLPLSNCTTHFFNHQTHHRGQATTLLSQAGIDMGVTDLIAMPK